MPTRRNGIDRVTPTDDLIAWLGGFEHRIPLPVLVDRLHDDALSADELAGFIRFSDERYCRNLVGYGSQFYVLLLCWKPGQASPIHDHRNATCGVRVVSGIATETRFREQGTGLAVERVRHLRAGEVCGSIDADIHQVRNEGDANLVTLHVYSPFLDDINLYDVERGRVSVFSDPLLRDLRAN